MSMNKIFIGSLIATSFGITGLVTTAEAQSSRYGSGTGFGNVYDYESGSCGDRCATPVNTCLLYTSPSPRD